jgi:hypothetical protein
MKSIYEFNRQLKELYNDAAVFQPITNQRTGELHRYDAIFKTGQFDGVYDYDAGILQISIYRSGVSISTIDGGVWRAFTSQGNTEIYFDKLLQVFNSLNGVLPTESELNKLLEPIGLYGCFTG